MTDTIHQERVLHFPVPRKKIIYLLLFTVAMLAIFHTVGQFVRYQLGYHGLFGFIELFHLDKESNIPTFFASVLLLSSAILLGGICWFTNNNDRHYWLLLTVLFLGLAIDESSAIHERLIDPVRRVVGVSQWFYYAWIIPAGIFLIVLSIYLLRFLWRLPAATRTRFLVAGCVFVGGAMGIEIIGGYYVFFHDKETLAYNLIAGVEEVMEMVGVVLFIRALLVYISAHLSNKVVLHIRDE